MLIDRQGRETARKMGAAEWDGPEMVSLVERTIHARNHTLRLQQADQARFDLNADHYRELATKLLTIAQDECHLSDPQLDLLALARSLQRKG